MPYRRVLCLCLLLAAMVALPTQTEAQDLPPLTPDQEAALYGIPVVTTFGGTLLLANVAEERKVQWLLLAMPLVAGATACGAGRLTGAPGSCRGALVSGALGALPGFALFGAGYVLGDGISLSDDTALALVLLGAAAYILVPPFMAIRGYRRGARADVALAMLPAPGARAPSPGLSLRVRF